MDIHEILKSVRENSGLTQKQVFLKSGIDDSALSAIENGQREPRLSQLSTLAEVYRVPLGYLLGESPMPTQLVMWRSKPEETQEIESQFLALCRQYHHLEVWTSEIGTNDLPRLDSGGGDFWYPEAAQLAEGTRKLFGLGDRPGESLYWTLEEVYGVKIFHLDLDSAGVAACANSPEFGPAILMNRNVCRWRRNHDLAHELFHLLTWERFGHHQEVCEPSGDEERLATCFAGNLLLPETPVRAVIERAKDGEGRTSFAKLDEIARQFDVSLESLMWRMHFLYGQEEEATLRNIEKARAFVLTAPRDEGSPPPMLPERYRSLAIRALQEGHVSLGRFAKYMEISRKEAQRYISGREPEYAETETTLA